uniref:Uncharacterized protein n=1 Tax=Anguilla anguilla TaxID=7936 RepID=A0A0E9W9H9_ANGAN
MQFILTPPPTLSPGLTAHKKGRSVENHYNNNNNFHVENLKILGDRATQGCVSK